MHVILCSKQNNLKESWEVNIYEYSDWQYAWVCGVDAHTAHLKQ